MRYGSAKYPGKMTPSMTALKIKCRGIAEYKRNIEEIRLGSINPKTCHPTG
jgi:hypothetical protein